MNREEAIDKLKTIISPYAKNGDSMATLNEGSDFITDLKINSANLVDIVLDIEEEFDITIDSESMEKMLNVRAALEIIEQKLAEK